jgi:cytochrome c oxidase subunit 2
MTTALGLAVAASNSTAFGAQPQPWEIGMQPAASPVAERIAAFHNELLVIIALIVLLVLALLVYVIVRFRASTHPVPTQTTHNTWLEVAWTTVPVLILVIIAIPSFRLLYYTDRVTNPDMTLKVTSHQWYWSYEYPDQGIAFDSYIIPEDELKPGQVRLLDVDNRVVVPIGATIRLLVTSSDVIHSFFVPSLGVQIYAVPGRLNQAWMRIDKPGVYYGQCNQLCGLNHAFMPIAIQAVSKPGFSSWVEAAKKKFAAAGTSELARK